MKLYAYHINFDGKIKINIGNIENICCVKDGIYLNINSNKISKAIPYSLNDVLNACYIRVSGCCFIYHYKLSNFELNKIKKRMMKEYGLFFSLYFDAE